LKVPRKQKPRGRLWLNDGSCVRLRPEQRNHIWSHDFVSAPTHDGRSLRILTLIDEYTRESLAIRVGRRLNSHDVIDTLAEAMVTRGVPEHIRSDNGTELVARRLRQWQTGLGTRPLYIEPGRTATANRSTASCATSCSTASLLLAQGSAGPDRAMAGALQHAAATLVARLPSAGTGCDGKSRAQFIGKCGDLD
jgi:hypothetical protein